MVRHVVCALVLLYPASARTQEAPPSEPPPELIAEEPAPTTPPPGRFRIGPLYLSPFLRVGNITYDSNIFYSADAPVSDVTASASPGIEIVLPVRGALRLRGSGALHYQYFLDHAELRRLTAGGSGGLEWNGDRAQAGAEYVYDRQFQRPNYEIDRRVVTSTETLRAHLLRHLFGRTRVILGADHRRTAHDDEEFLGESIARALNRTQTSATAGIDYALTIKTSLVVEAEPRRDRFEQRTGQDLDTLRVVGGLRTGATALVAGHLLGGVRWLMPVDPLARNDRVWVALLDAQLNASPKTRLGLRAQRDQAYSAFGSGPGQASMLEETVGARLDKDLVAGCNFLVSGRATRYRRINGQGDRSDDLSAGPVHENEVRELAVDLGYRFRNRLRLGFEGRRIERTSSLDVYEMDGWVLGFTASLQP